MLSANAVKNAVRKNDYSIQKNACIMHTFPTVILANKYRIIPIVSGCYAVKKCFIVVRSCCQSASEMKPFMRSTDSSCFSADSLV